MRISLFLALMIYSTVSFSQEPDPDAYRSAKSLDDVFGQAKSIVFGNVVSIHSGRCGPLGDTPDSDSVGYSNLKVRKVIRGFISKKKSDEGKVIKVCSPGRLLLGGDYIFSGYQDSDGNFVADTEGVVMLEPTCNRYFRVDYMAPSTIISNANVEHVAVGSVIPDFEKRYGPILGIDLKQFHFPESSYVHEHMCGSDIK